MPEHDGADRSGHEIRQDTHVRCPYAKGRSDATIAAAGRVIPRSLRAAAFALAADLVLADGRIDRPEQRFLDALADRLGLQGGTRDGLRDAMLVKNSA